jgi:predicted nucleotidyltransferase
MSVKIPELKLLPNIFRKYSDICAVYLFGSFASGRTHRESDLDLAIVPSSRILQNQKLDILADLARRGFDRVDLVFLDTTDVVLKFEAVRHNRLVYCADNFDASAFYSLTLRQYWDFLPYLEVQRKAYKERILQHGAR